MADKAEEVRVAKPTQEVSCKDCRVGRGYRPILDYPILCSLHAAAPDLYEALKAAKEHLDWTGYAASDVSIGDSYEQDCARESKLKAQIDCAIAKAEEQP